MALPSTVGEIVNAVAGVAGAVSGGGDSGGVAVSREEFYAAIRTLAILILESNAPKSHEALKYVKHGHERLLQADYDAVLKLSGK